MLQVERHRVVGMLMRHLDQAVNGELLGDLVTLLSQRQVEPL